MTREEIVAFFQRFSSNVTDPASFGEIGITKAKIFEFCLERLHTEDQYRALVTLCVSPPAVQYVNTMPPSDQREELLLRLHHSGEADGIAVRAIRSIPSWEIRREWLKTTSRLEVSPEAAVTSARTLLETTCKAILIAYDKGDEIRSEGDVGKLVKSTQRALGVSGGARSIATAVGSLTNGLSEVSNAEGDRHGGEVPHRTTLANARLMTDMCFALAIYFLDLATVHPKLGSEQE